MTNVRQSRAEWEELKEEIKAVQAQIVLLTQEYRQLSNCLLEMSEVFYA